MFSSLEIMQKSCRNFSKEFIGQFAHCNNVTTVLISLFLIVWNEMSISKGMVNKPVIIYEKKYHSDNNVTEKMLWKTIIF